MKNAAIIFFMLSGVFLGAGCKTLRPASQTSTIASDSTVVTQTAQLVPVTIPADTIEVSLGGCPEWGNEGREAKGEGRVTPPAPIVVKGKRSSASVQVDELGRLRMIFNCDEWRDSVSVLTTEVSRLKQSVTRDSTVVTIQQPFVPKIYVASMWFSWLVIAAVAGYLGFNIIKTYLKIS